MLDHFKRTRTPLVLAAEERTKKLRRSSNATSFHVVPAAEICGTFLIAKVHLLPSRGQTWWQRDPSPPCRTQTLTFPLSGSQERSFGCLKRRKKEASGGGSATVVITTARKNQRWALGWTPCFSANECWCVSAVRTLRMMCLNVCTTEWVVTMMHITLVGHMHPIKCRADWKRFSVWGSSFEVLHISSSGSLAALGQVASRTWKLAWCVQCRFISQTQAANGVAHKQIYFHQIPPWHV